MEEPNGVTEKKAIYQFTRGLDKKLRDVMVYSYDAMVSDYIKLSEKNYRSITQGKYSLETIKLIIAVSVFYRIILKPLYGGRAFIERLNDKYSVGVRIGLKGQQNVDIDGIADMQAAFYAISKSFGVNPEFFDFQETTELIKKLTISNDDPE